ncbi:hypothetical protein [Elizabethkingia anophelis]|uniref:hypothetical protein n=1 Tax=Elizabethkingia anophelis TaxID=1117645 RepID=UPI001623906D|nr:hypothetical protein [Elizabethkingia anophelis]MCT4321799.1 hypothetical protein [Elizabethkingia anophelis]
MKLKHIPTGFIGYFVKEIESTQLKPWTTWVIKLDNGSEYYAPKNEFTIIK